MKQLKSAFVFIIIVAFSFGLSVSLSFGTEEQNQEQQLNNPTVSNGTTTWDLIEFGTYPQAEIVNSNSYTKLPKDAVAPEDLIVDPELYTGLESSDEWTSYSGRWNNGGTYQWGTLVLDGEKYYRTGGKPPYQYFKYQPVKWRVLSVDDNKAVLLADKALDTDWLTNTVEQYTYFYDNAFTDNEKESVGALNDKYKYSLSREDVCETDRSLLNGFLLNANNPDNARRCYSSIFAKARGASFSTYNSFYGCTAWSIYDATKPKASNMPYGCVGNSGRVGKIGHTGDIICIRPAILLDLSTAQYSCVGTTSSKDTFKRINSETPPIIEDIRVTNSTVYRPGIVEIQVQVTAKDAGIVGIHTNVSLSPNDGSGNGIAGGYWEGSPIYKKNISIKIPLTANMKTGTWRVSKLDLVDSLGNYYRTELFSGAGRETVGPELPEFDFVDEFNYQITTDISNPNLVDRIKEISEGNAIRINLINNNNYKMPKEAFEAIRGRDVTVVAYSNSYQWIFNGLDVVNECKDVNLKTTISTVSKEEYQIDENAVAVTFAPNGTLPCKTEIRFKSDYLYNLYKIKGELLLYYDNGGTMELQKDPSFDLIFDGTDKWCHFSVDHNSRYIISGKSLSKLAKKKANTLVVKAKKPTVKYSKVKKKTQIITVKKAFAVSKAKGKVTFKKTSGNRKISINSAGKITIKKGLKKGKYKVKVKVTAAGNKIYKALTKSVKLTITVK